MGKPPKMGREMSSCFITTGSIITPLGRTLEENLQSMEHGKTGIRPVLKAGFKGEDLPLAKITQLEGKHFDQLLSQICDDLEKNISADLLYSPHTIYLLSSTKGNIELFPEDSFSPAKLYIQHRFRQERETLVVSNACISGVVAINTASDMLEAGLAEAAVVIGIDTLSDFITFGFQSLFAVSDEPAKPFDAARKGISLGEAGAAVVLSKRVFPTKNYTASYLGGSSSNDANHISGPSRTGEGLVRTIENTFKRTGKTAADIDFISAHGTATLFNDEMESIAFSRLGLKEIPMNSLKGYFGHTFGAAGIIESIFCLASLENNRLYKSMGFEVQGTSEEVNVIRQTINYPVQTILKTASGFGGGNASLILSKPEHHV